MKIEKGEKKKATPPLTPPFDPDRNLCISTALSIASSRLIVQLACIVSLLCPFHFALLFPISFSKRSWYSQTAFRPHPAVIRHLRFSLSFSCSLMAPLRMRSLFALILHHLCMCCAVLCCACKSSAQLLPLSPGPPCPFHYHSGHYFGSGVQP